MDEEAEWQKSLQIIGYPLQKGVLSVPRRSLRTKDSFVPLSPVLLSISGVAAIVRENYERQYFISHCARRCPTSSISHEA